MTRNATGTVRRLHAAVVVNHRSNTDPKGKVTGRAADRRRAREADRAGAAGHRLQQGAGRLGAGGERALPHRSHAAAEAVPFYLQPWVQDLLRAGLAPGALALVALVVVFALIRPASRPPPRRR
jgi:flagellar M-ring protein FliF